MHGGSGNGGNGGNGAVSGRRGPLAACDGPLDALKLNKTSWLVTHLGPARPLVVAVRDVALCFFVRKILDPTRDAVRLCLDIPDRATLNAAGIEVLFSPAAIRSLLARRQGESGELEVNP